MCTKVENPYLIAGPFVEINFGFVKIEWSLETSPVITLKSIYQEGAVELEHQVFVNDL